MYAFLSQTFPSLFFDKGCLSLSKHRSSRGGAERRREKDFRKKKQGSKEEKKTLGTKKVNNGPVSLSQSANQSLSLLFLAFFLRASASLIS